MQANPSPTPANKETGAVTPAPTTDAAVPDYPKDLYDAAHIDNGAWDLNRRLVEARYPEPKPEYVPPPIPVALAEQTKRELEAGRKRVAEFEQAEAQRKEVSAQRRPEAWEGKSTPVFRPPDAEEYKSTFKSPAQTVSKDAIAQPRR